MAKSVPPSFLPSSPLHLVLLLPFLRSVLHSRASFSKLYYMEYPTARSLSNIFVALQELTGRFILMGQHGLWFWTESYPIKLKSAPGPLSLPPAASFRLLPFICLRPIFTRKALKRGAGLLGPSRANLHCANTGCLMILR